MIPWRQAVRESVENGRLPLWNRFLLGGEPLLGLLFFVGYPVTPSVAPLPLLLLALWRLCGGGGLAAAALMTAALVLMAIAGHPETLLFAVTGAGGMAEGRGGPRVAAL